MAAASVMAGVRSDEKCRKAVTLTADASDVNY